MFYLSIYKNYIYVHITRALLKSFWRRGRLILFLGIKTSHTSPSFSMPIANNVVTWYMIGKLVYDWLILYYMTTTYNVYIVCTALRYCVRPNICGSNVIAESLYCFTEGSRCLELAMNQRRSDWSPPSSKGHILQFIT